MRGINLRDENHINLDNSAFLSDIAAGCSICINLYNSFLSSNAYSLSVSTKNKNKNKTPCLIKLGWELNEFNQYQCFASDTYHWLSAVAVTGSAGPGRVIVIYIPF